MPNNKYESLPVGKNSKQSQWWRSLQHIEPIFKRRMSDQVEQTMHRMLSLEMSLSTLAKSGRLNLKQVEPRVKAIRTLQMELHRCQHLIGTSKQELGNVPIDQMVPTLGQCTPIEQQIYANFSKERHKLLEALASEVLKLKSWAKTARTGFWANVFTTLRLSKIARLVSSVDRWMKNVESEHLRVDMLIRKAIVQMSPRQENNAAPQNVEGLIKIFSELDATAIEITNLRESIRAQEQTIIQMRAWLQREEEFIGTQSVAVPSVEAIEIAQASFTNHTLDPLQNTKKRLVIARKFADEYASIEPVVESFIGRATTRHGNSNLKTNKHKIARVGS